MFDTVWHRWFRVPYTLHVFHEVRVKNASTTLVFLHGIGNSSHSWDDVIDLLPDGVSANIVALDLLGFGESPQPDWAVYSAATQAKAVAKTLLVRGFHKPVILVGHSMGALVAIEYAKRYPLAVRSLLLCSPPIYNVDASDDKKLFAERDEQLRRLYEFAIKNPDNIVRFSELAKRYKILNPHFDVDHLNVDSYIAALRTNILSQTSLKDILSIEKPIHIIYGTLDPFVNAHNLKKIAKSAKRVSLTRFIGGHEIVGRYAKRVVRLLLDQLGRQ